MSLTDVPHAYSRRSTRRLRIASLSPGCFLQSQEYLATYRFVRLLSDLCRPKIPKPTPEQFFNAFMDHHAKLGIPVSRDDIVKLMLKHAKWLAEQAKQYVDVRAWKEFALTKVLDVDEEWDADAEMGDLGHRPLARTIPIIPIALTPSPRRKRVRPPVNQKCTGYSTPSYSQSRSVGSQSSLEYASDGPLFEDDSERGSSPERSPSPPLTNPYIAARVPTTFCFAPRIPDDFHWWCEIEKCQYSIDFLNLTNENLAMLDGETAAKLRLQDWSLSDPWVRLAFKTMVEDHRVKHLESWGLRCIEGPSGVHRTRRPLLRPPSEIPTFFRPSRTSNSRNLWNPIDRRTSFLPSRSNSSAYYDCCRPN